MTGPSRRPARDDLPAHVHPDRRYIRNRYIPWVLGGATGLVVCMAATLLLILINRPAPSPAGTASAICTDLRAADYASLYAVLTPSLQQQGTDPQTEFSASQQELDIVSGRVASCAYHLEQPDSTHATVTYFIARGSKPPLSGQVILVYLNGSWRIQGYDTSLV